jgi:hypothetical protein
VTYVFGDPNFSLVQAMVFGAQTDLDMKRVNPSHHFVLAASAKLHTTVSLGECRTDTVICHLPRSPGEGS